MPYLEAYRKLSGSVTHDINNLLSSILGYSELLRMDISDANLRSSVDEIRTAGKRIASLTQLLSAFTDKYIYRPELLDLNEEISALKKYCADILGKLSKCRQVQIRNLAGAGGQSQNKPSPDHSGP